MLPDDGFITPVADRDGVEGVREITNSSWMIGPKISSTFHCRDISRLRPRILPPERIGHSWGRR